MDGITSAGGQRLRGKVAIVTGASSGIGREICRAFGREGAQVIVTDVHETRGAEGWAHPGLTTTESIIKDGGSAKFEYLDVTQEQAFEDLVASTAQRHGRVDLVVNNAGVVRADSRLHTFTAQDLDYCYQVNTRGNWNGTMAAIRYFLAEKIQGHVLNVVSTAGINPWRDEGPYALTKAAAAMLVRNAASEYGKDGIRVNGICPTFVRTPMSQHLTGEPAFREFINRLVPLGRFAEVTDIANAAVFLASDEASFLTGVLLPVDGGESVVRPEGSGLG